MAQTKKMEQKAKEIRSGISVNRSMSEKNITIIQGKAQSDAKQILALANANATNMTISATADAYKQLETDLTFADVDLDQFIYYSDLQTSETASFAYGINNAIISFAK